MREDILCDFQKAVGKAITDGMSIQEFRKEFDSIVKRTGWQHNGSRNWRSDLIYQTNLHTAYAAGRERQMQDSKMRKCDRSWRTVAKGTSTRHGTTPSYLWTIPGGIPIHRPMAGGADAGRSPSALWKSRRWALRSPRSLPPHRTTSRA